MTATIQTIANAIIEEQGRTCTLEEAEHALATYGVDDADPAELVMAVALPSWMDRD